MSEFWEELFYLVGTNLLTSTAYHPQTDGLSERTNQTVEIALRYLLASTNKSSNWVDALPAIQTGLNNATHAATGLSPNESIYGFKVREALSLLGGAKDQDHEIARTLYQREASEAIAFANIKSKAYYDRRHKPLFLNAGDQVLVRLHKGYKLPESPNPKLFSRYAGPFTVIRRIGRLAYEFDLPVTWKVHPVISVEQLEPFPSDADPYGR